MHPDTLAVHGGQREHGGGNFPVPPLVLNSAVLLDSVQHGWDMLTYESVDNIAYQRYSNSTVKVLEEKFASMEGAKFSLAINSGMSACFLVFRALLRHDDHIVIQHSLYHEISDQVIFDKESCGVDYTMIDDYSIESFAEAIQQNTQLIFIESPTNPAMYDIDIKKLAKLCREKNIVLVVDNTLLTHEYQKPLNLGAHITLYSTTKSINGHGDALGAIISTNDPDLCSKIKSLRDNIGLIIDPFSAWLVIRGLRSLRIRLERHSENAKLVINFLQKKYPQYQLMSPDKCQFAKKNENTGNGGVISIVLKNKEQGTIFISNLSLIKIGTTFGNLESLCYHFGTFTRPHRDISKIGIPQGLVRLSIGIENANDIIEDIDRALMRL